MTIKVTHINASGHRRQILVRGGNVATASAWAEQLFGEATYLAAIALHGAPQ